MEQQLISTETLADMHARGYGVNAMCERCRHSADLDLQALMDKLGAGFVYVGAPWIAPLACSRCGAHDGLCQIHPLNSNRSRFAD
jgi:hypothetical protein